MLANQPPTTEVDIRIVPYTDRRAWRQLGARSDGDALNYRESWVKGNGHRIDAREYPGQEPAIVLMHGFPDNLHLYDRLLPHLTPPRRVITFDFLGWGGSDKPTGYPYTASNQTGDLDAVIGQLGLQQVTVVVHDASGPSGIDWALKHPDRVAALVLLNTYYCAMPGLRSPEAIWLFSTPLVHQVTHPGVAPVRRPGVLAHVPAPPTRGNTS